MEMPKYLIYLVRVFTKGKVLLLSGSVLDEALFVLESSEESERGRDSGRPFMTPGGGPWVGMTGRALPGERVGPEGAGSEEAGTHTGSSSSGTEGRSGGIEKDCRLIGLLGVLEDQMIRVKFLTSTEVFTEVNC